MASDSRVLDSEDANKPDDAQQSPPVPVRGAGPEPKVPPAADGGAGPSRGAAPAPDRAKPHTAAGSPAGVPAQPGAVTPPPGTRPPVPDAAGGKSEPDLAEEFSGPPWWARRFWLFQAVPGWLVSMVFHAVLLMLLALITLPDQSTATHIVAVANPTEIEEVENLESESIDPMDVTVFEGEAPADAIAIPTTTAVLDVPSLDDISAGPAEFKLTDLGELSAPSDDLMNRIGGGISEGLGEARGAAARKGMLEQYGGSEGSEAAVAAALKWFAVHQERDGGWNFDHTRGTCRGQCSHPGLVPPARNAATAMALLPFLGAGQTHREGEYKELVERGLVYLIRNMKVANGMGDLSDAGGRLYSHGMAAIALCEAYAMTNDSQLLQPAQFALNFIAYAQDPVGGGWRYEPKQAGDTSVLGWQLMACKSGHMAYLRVPRQTIQGASKFLDFVQEAGGSHYGYTVPGAGPATTAVGLLSRMYLGWKHDEPALAAGIEYLNKTGPTDNMYYNYYATQVLRHYGGPYWDAWNSQLRDRLVAAQDTKGHAKGSWYFSRDPWVDRGGRLYCTSMATMILEVYYRHMPIYGKQAAEDDFPL